jgi:hypothetical protein
MSKIDFKKELKHLYRAPSHKPSIVEVPTMNYLMIDGKGHPEEANFQDAARTLFPVAYVTKFIVKGRALQNDYVVMPMEVKWKLDRNEKGSKRYAWTMMIMQPAFITSADIHEAIAELEKKKKEVPLSLSVRLDAYEEGLCAQIFHKGPYGEPMERTFDLLKTDVAKRGYEWEKDSHDIYFNDVRRVPPEKLKTLIRVRIWK